MNELDDLDNNRKVQNQSNVPGIASLKSSGHSSNDIPLRPMRAASNTRQQNAQNGGAITNETRVALRSTRRRQNSGLLRIGPEAGGNHDARHFQANSNQNYPSSSPTPSKATSIMSASVPSLSQNEREALLKQQGLDASMDEITLIFDDPILEAKYIQYETREVYARYAVVAGVMAFFMLAAIVLRDAAFYLAVWKDAENCNDLFSPRCRSLGLRIVVALFAFPAILIALCLHHAYATRVRVIPSAPKSRLKSSSQLAAQHTQSNQARASASSVVPSSDSDNTLVAASMSKGHDDGILGQSVQLDSDSEKQAHHQSGFPPTTATASLNVSNQQGDKKRGGCLGCGGVPIDVALSILLAGGCFVYSRTVNDENSSLPVDLTSVSVFFVYLHVLGSFLSVSYAMAILTWIGFVGYVGCTIGFAYSTETLLYSSDYAAASQAAQAMSLTLSKDQFAPLSLKKRRFELAWAIFWPFIANLIGMCAGRFVELKRRQNFALFERFVGSAKQNMDLRKQAQDLWNELYKDTPDTFLVDPDGNEGDFDLTSPAEKAITILREVQRDADMTNDSFLKLRRVIMLLTSAHDYFKPVSNRLTSADGGDDELLRWVLSLMDPFSAAAAAEKAKKGKGLRLKNPHDSGSSPGSEGETPVSLYIPPPLADADEEVIVNILADVDDWSYDVFGLDAITNGHPLVYMGIALFRKFNLQQKFNITNEVLSNFLRVVEEAYLDKPYHNRTHAADVMRTTSYFISVGCMGEAMSDLEILAALIAAAVHDVGHPGINNRFHIASKHELALLYNDRSVLENYHAAYAFRLLMRPENNILSQLDSKQYDECRHMIIDMVLATDLQHHFEFMGQFKPMLSSSATIASDHKFRAFGMRMAIKCADVGHAAKPLDLHLLWCERVCEEFYKQGDQERKRNIPISPFMDRYNSNLPKSQIGFFDFIVGPMYEAFMTFLEPPEEDLEDEDDIDCETSSIAEQAALGFMVHDETNSYEAEEKLDNSLPCLQQVAENRAYWVEQLELMAQQPTISVPSPQSSANVPVNIQSD